MRNEIGGVILLGALMLPGCIRTVDLGTVEVAQDIRQESGVRTATNLPQEFTVVIPARMAGDCPPRLRDEVVGATLDLQRGMMLPVQDGSGTRYDTFGDYRITPSGHYGAASPADGLRVNCGRLRGVGLVRLGAAGGE